MNVSALALLFTVGLGSDAAAATPVSAQATCLVATPTAIEFAWPSRITISDTSIANFERFNSDGHGSLIVITYYDGSVKTIIPPTSDIDDKLHKVLEAFARGVTSTPTVACNAPTGMFLVRFDVPSGKISHVQLHAPAQNDSK